jgi:putative ATPase
MPEGIYPIVEATLYLATAPKSNSAGAYFKAFQLVEEQGRPEVPQHLQDATGTPKPWGTGRATSTRTKAPDHFLPQQYLPGPCWVPISTSPPTRATKQGGTDRDPIRGMAG